MPVNMGTADRAIRLTIAALLVLTAIFFFQNTLARRPKLALVDELAHTNAPGIDLKLEMGRPSWKKAHWCNGSGFRMKSSIASAVPQSSQM